MLPGCQVLRAEQRLPLGHPRLLGNRIACSKLAQRGKAGGGGNCPVEGGLSPRGGSCGGDQERHAGPEAATGPSRGVHPLHG